MVVGGGLIRHCSIKQTRGLVRKNTCDQHQFVIEARFIDVAVQCAMCIDQKSNVRVRLAYDTVLVGFRVIFSYDFVPMSRHITG